MGPIVVKPEKELRAVWHICWAIPFAIGLTPGVLLTFVFGYPGNLVMALCTLGWLMLMVPIGVWIPAFCRSLAYVIDSDSVKGEKGVFWKKRVAVPYTKVTNVDVTQGPLERAFNIGTVHVQTAGAGGAQGVRAELTLLGVRDLDGLKDTIMARVRGCAPSGAEGAQKELGEESDSDIFRRMLEELAAIRAALERERG